MRKRKRVQYFVFQIVCWLDNREQVFFTKDLHRSQALAVYDGQGLIQWAISRNALILRAEVKIAYLNGV